MFRLRTNIVLFFLCLGVLLFTGCGFADLRPIGYSTIPKEAYGILPELHSPVSISFDTPMAEPETKNAFQVLSPSGSVEGEFIWKENKLEFVPASQWLPGLRYLIKLSGTVRSVDGRELLLSRELPFYVVSKSDLPFVESFSPGDGASVEVFCPGDLVLEFVFSVPMERQSTETAFSCEGLAEKNFLWLDGDRVLQIFTGNRFSPWADAIWSISEKAKSKDGAPLAREVSGRFITDKDYDFPKVEKLIPLLKSETNGAWGFWSQADTDLGNGLGAEQALGVEFNKAVDMESIERAFIFDPPLPGRVEQAGSAKAVFIPDRNTEPETLYTMKISRDISDEAGLKMGKDFVLSFMSDIPFLKILSFAPDGSEIALEPGNQEIFTANVDEGDGGTFRFTIRFSLPFTGEAKKDGAFGISLEPFFPETLKSPVLKFVRWLNSDLLRMEWEGVKGGKSGEAHYYRLVLPGGRNGVSNGNGSFLKEDTYFFIEAAEQ